MVFSFFAAMNPLSLRIDKKITIHQIFLLAHNWSQGITRLNNPPPPPHLVKLGDIEWIEWYPRI